MVIDNYGNLIEEPFHHNEWAIEVKSVYMFWDDDSESVWDWMHFRSYDKPIDAQKALYDLRENAERMKDAYDGVTIDRKFRVCKRIYRKVETGFHVGHLQDATDNLWWNDTPKPLSHLKAVEEDRITKL